MVGAKSTDLSASERGPCAPTLRDVAALCGVSVKTASRVLNDDPRVAADTRANVQQAMERLGYRPDAAARSLRAGHDRVIGVIVDSISDVFFAELAAAIESTLNGTDYRCLIASSNRSPEMEAEIAAWFLQRRCAGMIVAPTRPDVIVNQGIGNLPVVFVDRAAQTPNSQSLVVDDHGLSKQVTEHLIKRGHSRIAYICEPPVLETTLNRLSGYREALADHGLPLDDNLCRQEVEDMRDVMRVLRDWLDLDQPPTAVVSAMSRISSGLVSGLHQFGRTDIAVVSFGDFSMAESLSPAVTVVDHSPRAIGAQAATMLINRLESGDVGDGSTVYVPTTLIQRGSGELPPSNSPAQSIPNNQGVLIT